MVVPATMVPHISKGHPRLIHTLRMIGLGSRSRRELAVGIGGSVFKVTQQTDQDFQFWGGGCSLRTRRE